MLYEKTKVVPLQVRSTMHASSIPGWIKEGIFVEAWLPPVDNRKSYSPARWHVKILSVHRATGRGRRGGAHKICVSWPGPHHNKEFIDWYPLVFDEVQDSITMPLFNRNIIQIEQLVDDQVSAPATSATAESESAESTSNPVISAPATSVSALSASVSTTTPSATSTAVTSAPTESTPVPRLFHERWNAYMRRAASEENDETVGVVDTPPEGTVCVECEEPIVDGQRWHKTCVSCQRPVHAAYACSISAPPQCRRCDTRAKCTAPQIPANLEPGTSEHAKHKNNKCDYLKQCLRYRSPGIKISQMLHHELYKELFGVDMHGARSRRRQPGGRVVGLQARTTKSTGEKWNKWCAGHYDPLFRIVMLGSDPNPSGKGRKTTAQWGLIVKQSKSKVILNMQKAGFPVEYINFILADTKCSRLTRKCFCFLSFKEIQSLFTDSHCQTCRCYILKEGPSFSPPRLQGILNKSVLTEQVSFEGITAPTYMDVEVPSPAPDRMTIAIADGRNLEVDVPGGCSNFHFKVPPRPNPYCSVSNSSPSVISIVGKCKRKRTTVKPKRLLVCKQCRLRQRDRKDFKRAKNIVNRSSDGDDSIYRARIEVYQAGARFKGAQVVYGRGRSNHWCGEKPSCDEHRLYGKYFCALLRKRMSRRVKRGTGLDAFTTISNTLASLPFFAKRVTNTALEKMYNGSFRKSSCAQAIRKNRLLPHVIEATTKDVVKHEKLMRELVTGVWTSSEKPVCGKPYIHIRAMCSLFLRTETLAAPTAKDWSQSQCCLVYQGVKRGLTIFRWRLCVVKSCNDKLIWKTTLSGDDKDSCLEKNPEWKPTISWVRCNST